MASRTTNASPLAYAITLGTALLIGFAGFGVGTLFSIAVVGVLGLVGVDVFAQPILLTVFGIESADHSLQALGAETPELLLILVPFSLLLVGPGEELLFRGVIQQLLRNRFGVTVGIALASIIFAVAHVGALTDEGLLATLLTYVALSIVLGVSYEYSENLVVPAVIHGLFNAIQFLILYWAITSGGEEALALLLL